MKKMLLILMVLVFTGTVQAVDLQLENPGFETGSFLPGWAVWGYNAPGIRIVDGSDGNLPHDGSGYCAGFRGNGPPDLGGAGCYQLYDADDPNIGAGAVVKLSGFGRAVGPAPTVSLILCWIPPLGGREKGRVTHNITFEAPLAEWTFGRVSGVVPATIDGIEIVQVKFEIANHHGLGEGFFDDFVAESTPCDPCCIPDDPCNFLVNESFECREDRGGGYIAPFLWATKTGLDACDVSDEVVVDGTALDRDKYWSLTESNEPNEGLYFSGYQGIIGEITDANSYRIVVNLRNPGAEPVEVQVGFDFYGPPFESYWGSDCIGASGSDEDPVQRAGPLDPVFVPADNQWHEYEHSCPKMLGSNMMEARFGVRNGTIHVDKTAVYDIGVEPCHMAKRDPNFVTLPGDMNNDCYVNFEDISEIVVAWLECIMEPNSLCP